MNNRLKKTAAGPLRAFHRSFFALYYRSARGRYRLGPVEKMPGMRLAVLAPHADDEVIGLGGLLSRLAGEGCAVKVFYLTNGARSEHPALSREALIAAREDEAQRTAAFYGLEPPVFLRLEDGALATSPENAALLKDALEPFRPEALFMPSLLDGHRDHTAASGLGAAALEGLGAKGDFPLYLYAVNSPLTHHMANRAFPLDGEALEKKRRALSLFRSQTLDFGPFLLLDECRRFALPAGMREGARGSEFFARTRLGTYGPLVQAWGEETWRNFRQIAGPRGLVRAFFSGREVKKSLGPKIIGNEGR